jgi:hypothetical protein
MRANDWSPPRPASSSGETGRPLSRNVERGSALMKNFTRRSTTAAVATLALVGAGVAFAAWTSTGTGSGSASADTDKGLVVTPGTASGLFPTGSKTVSVTVKNNNSYPVTLDGASVAHLAVQGSPVGCTTNAVTATVPTAPNARIAAGATATVTDIVTVAMGADGDNGCQGKAFTFDLTVTGHSSN